MLRLCSVGNSLLTSFPSLPFVVILCSLVQSSLGIIMSAELQQQLQQQMAAMQQQFAAERQQMEQQMTLMAQENRQLQSLRVQPPPQVSSSSSVPGPSAPRIDIRLMQPSSFHGTASSNANQWLMEVERYFVAVNLEADDKRIVYASTFLKDAASMWYFNVNQELDNSWVNFKARFLSRFQPIAAAKVARAQLRLLKQRHRVAGYSQEFMRLIQLIPDMHLADQLESYMIGLHQDLAIEVEKKEPETLLEAMEFAQRIELMTTGRRQAYGRLPGIHHFSRSSSSSSHDRNAMDLSAIHQVDDAQDFFYGTEHLPSQADSTIVNTVEHVLNGMFQRNGGKGGFKRGGKRGNGPNSSAPSNYNGLGKEEYDKLSKEGKCFNCKNTGHLARNCTIKPKN